MSVISSIENTVSNAAIKIPTSCIVNFCTSPINTSRHQAHFIAMLMYMLPAIFNDNLIAFENSEYSFVLSAYEMFKLNIVILASPDLSRLSSSKSIDIAWLVRFIILLETNILEVLILLQRILKAGSTVYNLESLILLSLKVILLT